MSIQHLIVDVLWTWILFLLTHSLNIFSYSRYVTQLYLNRKFDDNILKCVWWILKTFLVKVTKNDWRYFDGFIHRGFAIAFLRRQAFNKMSLGFFTMSHKRPSTAHCLGHTAQGWSFSVIIKGGGSYTEHWLYDYYKGISIKLS